LLLIVVDFDNIPLLTEQSERFTDQLIAVDRVVNVNLLKGM
jgi:hypothetical protein